VNIAVIGGGAAGFFAAINIKENYPDARVVIYEKSSRLLAKVRISGGGRCNVTNGCTTLEELCAAYPRGANALKKAFRIFDNRSAINWFERHRIPLVTQDDNCVFPQSQDAKTIISCFLDAAARLDIQVITACGVKGITGTDEGLQLRFIGDIRPPAVYDKVVVATGGSPQRAGLAWLERAGHKIVEPVPSLFTFKIPHDPVTELMGIVVDPVQVSLQGTKFRAEGPLLVTHWGMSGPAILKLSALAARWLAEQNYRCSLHVNWADERNQETVAEHLAALTRESPRRMLSSVRPFKLPERLWFHLLDKCALSHEKRWGEIGKSGINKLIDILTRDCYQVTGKGQFKDEFVTCGGISLADIDIKTMQSKVLNGLYFAGEVLDIDGLTGGFNFQAAWTTAYIAASLQ